MTDTEVEPLPLFLWSIARLCARAVGVVALGDGTGIFLHWELSPIPTGLYGPPAAAFFDIEQVVMAGTQATAAGRTITFEAHLRGPARAQFRQGDKLKIVDSIV